MVVRLMGVRLGPPRAFSLSLSLSLSPRIFHLPQRFLPLSRSHAFHLNPPGAAIDRYKESGEAVDGGYDGVRR